MFSKEPGGFQELLEPPEGRESSRFHSFASEHRSCRSPGQCWSRERRCKGGKTTPSSTGKRFGSSPAASPAGPAANSSSRKGEIRGIPTPLLVPPALFKVGKLRHGGAGGGCATAGTPHFPHFPHPGMSRSQSSSSGWGFFPAGWGRLRPSPFQPQQNTEGFGIFQRSFWVCFSLVGANPWTRAPGVPSGVLFWVQNDPSSHSRGEFPPPGN